MSHLDAFEASVVERPLGSCSCSMDCDYERHAAYAEIVRLRGWLKKIAGQDYRGNPPTEIGMAARALEGLEP